MRIFSELALDTKRSSYQPPVLMPTAEITSGDNVAFRVDDQLESAMECGFITKESGSSRKRSGGFNSSLVLSVDSAIHWSDMNCNDSGGIVR